MVNEFMTQEPRVHSEERTVSLVNGVRKNEQPHAKQWNLTTISHHKKKTKNQKNKKTNPFLKPKNCNWDDSYLLSQEEYLKFLTLYNGYICAKNLPVGYLEFLHLNKNAKTFMTSLFYPHPFKFLKLFFYTK